MNMVAHVELSLYEALTEAGVKPNAARNVERQVEGAIVRGQETVRAEMHQRLMTKADGAELKAELKQDIAQVQLELKQDITQVQTELQKTITDQTWKLATLVVVANGITVTLMVALIKFL